MVIGLGKSLIFVRWFVIVCFHGNQMKISVSLSLPDGAVNGIRIPDLVCIIVQKSVGERLLLSQIATVLVLPTVP
jgi:hypothetical protein